MSDLLNDLDFYSLDELLDQALEKVSTGEPSPDTTREERKRRADGATVGETRGGAVCQSRLPERTVPLAYADTIHGRSAPNV